MIISGDEFCARSGTSLGVLGSTAEGCDRIYAEGKRIIANLLSIEIPVIGAVNPAERNCVSGTTGSFERRRG
jgi:hypothetical protein